MQFFMPYYGIYFVFRNLCFAPGIENSELLINNGKKRVDEMEKVRSYINWQKDFDLVKKKNPVFEIHQYIKHVSHGKYDWPFADQTFQYLK